MGIIAVNAGKSIGQTRILSDINLTIDDGDFVSLTGRSGSGKSTLLYLLSSLDDPTVGRIEIEEQDLSRVKSETLHRFRNEKMGFVFQFHYLIAELSAIENMLLPARKAKREQERQAYAEALLERFGLKDKMKRLPRQLSGGEQQRVAIARALVMEPKYLFADEPTGSLDTVNGESVMQIICDVNEKQKTTVLLVTHDPDFAKLAKRQVHLVDGMIKSIA